ncbi:MAG: metallophosphoesterase, partial [Chitinophagaceae bacterium]|nr:metallophosphoesterase [Chitinophagaceae bacterium]
MRNKKYLFKSLIGLLFFVYTNAQVDTIAQRIFLVGDAGGFLHGTVHPVIDWLKQNVDWNNEKNAIIFLGDNIYPLGMPSEGESSYPEAKKIIDYQIDLVKGKKAKAYFIPGNHDWKNGKQGGWLQVVNQVNYINSRRDSFTHVWAYPENGCPGPVEVEGLNEKVAVVLADSQWFLYVHDKPGPTSNCDAKTVDEFKYELQEIADRHPDQLLILAMHHPMYSHGVHGGDYGWKHHIFPLTERIPWLYLPLPILGSIYPITRGIFGNLQDVHHPLYRNMITEIEEVLKSHPNAMQVAGHEHSLQLLIKDSIPYVISGSGINLTRVKKGKYSVFEESVRGFATIEVGKAGSVKLNFYDALSKDLSTPIFTQRLKTIIPPKSAPVVAAIRAAFPTDTTVVANAKLKGNGFKRFMMGKNYRSEWTEAVTVPVLDIKAEAGGLKPTRKGGGKQTKSLRLEDKTGKEWALRSIEKFPEAAIPPDLRKTIARDIVQDGISASYPYASLSISPFASASDVPVIRRKLVYVPDDPELGRFQKDFANTLAILEEREPDHIKHTDNTDELVLKLAKDNDRHVDQTRVLKARLMDNFIMDFDRHEDQWRWATYDTGKGKVYYPIPRDHDQAFFTNQGVI